MPRRAPTQTSRDSRHEIAHASNHEGGRCQALWDTDCRQLLSYDFDRRLLGWRVDVDRLGQRGDARLAFTKRSGVFA